MEGEFAERVLACLDLDDGRRQAVLQALTSKGPQPGHGLDFKRAEAALANNHRKQQLGGSSVTSSSRANIRPCSAKSGPWSLHRRWS